MNIEEEHRKLGQRIRDLLKEQNLTVRGFALMVGLSKDYIVDLEFGRKSPTFETLLKISAGFGITLSELLEGIGVPDDRKQPEPPAEHDSSKGLQRGYVRYHSSHI